MPQKTFLFFSAQYLPTSGGVERYTFNLARVLRKLGHRVIVATSTLKGLPGRETDSCGIEVFRFPSAAFMGGRLPLLKPGGTFRQRARELWSIPIDFCVINTYFYPLSMYAASETHRRKIPAIVINHGSAWLMTGNPLLTLAGKIYETAAVKLCFHYCKAFYGVSEASREWVGRFHIPTKGVVTNAVDPEELAEKASHGGNWRQKLHLSPDAEIISFVGRMIPEKGVEPLIAAMRTIRAAHPNACLLMAGTGPLLDICRDTAPAGVYLLGEQPYGDVLALLKQSAVFCLPSRSEGFACTVLEAAALHCPIVTTRTGGSPQLLIDPSYGTLLPSMRPEDIASACIHALSNEKWCETAAKHAYRRLMENYTWEVAARQLGEAFTLT